MVLFAATYAGHRVLTLCRLDITRVRAATRRRRSPLRLVERAIPLTGGQRTVNGWRFISVWNNAVNGTLIGRSTVLRDRPRGAPCAGTLPLKLVQYRHKERDAICVPFLDMDLPS